MKTKKLFLIYNNPDDSIILWDKQEIICSWATDTPISEVLKDIETEHKEEEEVYRIYLVLSFDVLKDLNTQEESKMTTKKFKNHNKQIKKKHEEDKKSCGKEFEQQEITLEEKSILQTCIKIFPLARRLINK